MQIHYNEWLEKHEMRNSHYIRKKQDNSCDNYTRKTERAFLVKYTEDFRNASPAKMLISCQNLIFKLCEKRN